MLNEQDSSQRQAYSRLTYPEFLEFLARSSEKWMEETEMASIELKRKIEYFLENMF